MSNNAIRCTRCDFTAEPGKWLDKDWKYEQSETPIKRTGLCLCCLRRTAPDEISFLSKPEETNDTWRVICPHCGDMYQVESDDEMYEEGEHEYECPTCEKKCRVTTYVDVSFVAEPLAE